MAKQKKYDFISHTFKSTEAMYFTRRNMRRAAQELARFTFEMGTSA